MKYLDPIKFQVQEILNRVFDREYNTLDTQTKFGNSASLDSFGRLRTGEPFTIFDSKQLHDNQPLFWDDQEVSGGSTTSVHSTDGARTRIGVALNTAGKRVRQTFMRFNYQPGKSQLVFLTAVMESGMEDGIKACVGAFDDDNGLFFCIDNGVLKVVRRTSVTGSAVDTEVTQANFNLDTVDGNGASGTTIDPTKTQIMVVDYEWLGVGRVRMGFVVDGVIIYVHEFNNANNLSTVYMSTPNLPLRYEIENDGTGAATTMDHICSTTISEGGVQEKGITRSHSTSGTHVDANDANSVYAILGIKLKSTHLDAVTQVKRLSMISETNDDFEWILYLNPTVADTFNYTDKTNSCIQTATGATANTVTGGTELDCGFAKSSAVSETSVNVLRNLGSKIDGTPDEIVLCARPLSANADIQATLTWLEVS